VRTPATLVGSVVAAILASMCCIGPLMFGLLGIGGIGFASALAPLRPWLIGATALFLAAGFYLAYRPRDSAACEDGVCRPADRRTQRVLLWMTTAFAVAFMTYPSWSGAFGLSRTAAMAGDEAAAHIVTLNISGMTCAACGPGIEQELLRVPGVVGARVDYATERAEIRLATTDPDPGRLIAAVERAGYKASRTDESAAAGASMSERSPLAGQWRGQLVVGEGRTSELVVDLGLAANRWVGQFDLHDFGVEDYPVGVALDGRRVTLHLSAAQIDFEGMLSVAGEAVAGIATSQGHRDSLVLRRTGEARFSDEFLALEKVAEDSTRVEPLSADGAELRRRFNEDRASTRLVMLLSPT